MITTLINWAIPTFCTGILGLITIFGKKFLAKIDNIDKKVDSLNTTVKDNDLAILWSQLKSKTDAILEKGFCTMDDKYCLEALFKCYKKMDGNHGMEATVSMCLALPSEKKEGN